MTAPLEMKPKTITREVSAANVGSNGKGNRWKPWQPRVSTTRVPEATPFSTYQTIFSGPATAPQNTVRSGPIPALIKPPSASPVVRDPNDVLRNTGYFAKEFLRRTFIWWYWGIYICLQILGLDFVYALLFAVFCLLIGGLVYGLVRSLDLAGKAPKSFPPSPLPPNPPHFPVTLHRTGSPAITQHKSGGRQLNPGSITGSEPIIGNSRLSIYHQNQCTWVEKISPRNRIGFGSASAAMADGYKPCKVCSP